MKKQSFLKTTGLLLMAAVSVIFFTGCPSKEPEYVDLGTIPEKYLATVPYQDGEVFYLQHESDRVVIPFKVMRYRERAHFGNDELGCYGNAPLGYNSKMSPAPNVFFNCEVDVTECKPDYPLNDIHIEFSNGYMADSVYYQVETYRKCAFISFGTFGQAFPFIGEHYNDVSSIDSVEVNGHVYYDVFKLDNPSAESETGVFVQNLLYNYEKGVLEIDMSNGEKYMRYEEE